MLLTIDCGNTNVVFAVFDVANKHPKAIWRCRTLATKTADEYASWLMPLMRHEGIAFTDIKTSMISSVVADANFNLERLCDKYFKVTANFIKSSNIAIDIDIQLPNPESLGADRIVNSVMAKNKYQTPCVIIDFGTATTFDVLNGQGAYCGGAIAPGINLSMEALHNAAAALPKISILKTNTVIGNTTVTAMQSGLYWGYVAMIEGMVNRISTELGETPTIIATGGLATMFADGTNIIDYVDNDLTLDGLRLIHDLNFGNKTLKSIA